MELACTTLKSRFVEHQLMMRNRTHSDALKFPQNHTVLRAGRLLVAAQDIYQRQKLPPTALPTDPFAHPDQRAHKKRVAGTRAAEYCSVKVFTWNSRHLAPF